MSRKLNFLAFVLFMFFSIGMTGQYYMTDNGKEPLFENKQKFIVHFESVKDIVGFESEAFKQEFSSVETFEAKPYMIITLKDEKYGEDYVLKVLGEFGKTIVSITPGYDLKDGFTLYPTRKVVYKPKSKDVESKLREFSTKDERVKNYEIKYGVVRITLTSSDLAIEIANRIYDTGLVEFSHPDFYAPISHTNDPLYTQQFQMNNTGQTLDGVTGVADMDCNAPEAWAISTGSSSITVAVIDDGLESHEDFNDAGGSSRVLGGYTPANNGNGTPNSSGAHGVSCAGSIAASHNNIGVRGVAPLSKMRSVNIFWGGESSQDIADGITWAKNNGADVMSNSWGYTSCTANFSNINNAISDAVNNGRGGLGTVIVFAAGNGYKSCVDFPANNANVIAVGAFTNQGVRSDYSNYGSALDIMAPSNAVSPQPGAGVRTTDRMGSAGYSSGNYTGGFGGTSSACPVVSGVVALLLGYDATLTDAQVKNILYSTAIDMGPAGVDSQYANGRVNAFGALQAAGGGSGGPTCTDGILNGNETGVDCGGPDCPPCSSGCNDNEVTLSITLDNYPEETSWQITDSGSNVVASGGTYGSQPDGSTITEDICLPDGCYTFTIFDSYGDGICCSYGSGSYSLTDGGSVLASGGSFGSSEATSFCLGNTGGGGGTQEVFAHYFESGWDGWADGGSDCYRYSGSRSYEGNYSIRIRDNSGVASSMTSSSYNLSSYNSVDLQFYFYSYSMENGEDFWVRYNDGSGWQTVATYARGTSFENNNFYTATITLDDSSFNLSSNAQFRFQCDASANPDHIYIDQVTLEGTSSSGSNKSKKVENTVVMLGSLNEFGFETEEDFTISPNPTTDFISINSNDDIKKVSVYGLDGSLLISNNANNDFESIDLSELLSGMYILKIETEEEVYTEKVIKK